MIKTKNFATIALLTIFFTIFSSCAEKENNINGTDIITLQDENITQGGIIKIKVNANLLSEKNVNDLYAVFLYTIKTDNRFRIYNVRKPFEINNNILFFSDTIPNDASNVIIDILHPTNDFSLERSPYYPIYTQSKNYSEGALNTLLFNSSDTSKYMQYFDIDRKLYPKILQFSLQNGTMSSFINYFQ